MVLHLATSEIKALVLAKLYVIIRSNLPDVCIPLAMRGVDCSTDHHLIRCILDVHVKRRRQAAKPKRRLNIAKLHTTTCRDDLRNSVQRAFASSSTTDVNSINDDWESFRSTAYTAAAESLGYPRRENAYWFDYNDPAIETLLRDNRTAFQERLSNTQSQAAIQHHAQAGEVQAFSDRGDSRRVFQLLKSIYGPSRPTSSPMLTADGNTLLTSKPDIMSRWKDYYATLLNRPSEINEHILESIQQCPIRDELDEFPTKRENTEVTPSLPICSTDTDATGSVVNCRRTSKVR